MIAAILLAAATAGFELRSGDFIRGGAIPPALMATDCGGENRSPSLIWSGAPKGTKSFAIVMHDPDAPIAGGFYHWIVYDLPASATQLSEGANLPQSELGVVSTGKAAYYGPCPPPGPAHHYVITLYALDVEKLGGNVPDDDALRARIAGHVLGQATITGTAAHP